MSTTRPIALAILTTALASPVLADEHQETIYLNPFAGFQLFDDARDLSETGTFGVGVEYRFLPRWAVEAVYSRAEADRKYAGGNSDFDEIRLDGTYYFAGPDTAWNPYVSLGAGNADFGNGPASIHTAGTNHEETRVNMGTGVRYNVSDSISLRGDLREFHGIDESTFDTMVSLGLSVAFSRTVGSPEPAPAPAPAPMPPADSDNDGVIDATDQCPNTPAGTSVDTLGCELDSDNDGVVNSADECPNTTAGATVDAKGCEGIVETVQTFSIQVQFPTNSSVIGDRYDDELRKVADALKANPETVVEVAGHTDSRGKASYNQWLSQRRAEAVAGRLTGKLGVDPDRVSAKGYGESEPVASNDTVDGRAQNRRVEARIQIRR
ncbi:OmpA family protein [Marinobacter sp. C2H3]|uniref:OmpA family protein n=1 Tax=Marinobacter sp. C2H3 TaxID=3119003 RepID=UPI00300F4961